MTSRDIYEKHGDRYHRLGREYHPCFPANGVWLVEDGKEHLIMRVGDVPDPISLAALCRYTDIAASAVVKRLGEGDWSPQELVEAMFKAIAKKEANDRLGISERTATAAEQAHSG